MSYPNHKHANPARRETVLVTGASGFIGGATVRYLADSFRYGRRKGKVLAASRDIRRFADQCPYLMDVVEFLPWDMGEPLLYSQEITQIIHAAGQGDPASYALRPYDIARDTMTGCIHMLDFAQKNQVKKVVYLSSCEVYGDTSNAERYNEKDGCTLQPLNSRAVYPLSKLACENLCLAAFRQFGTPVSIARLCHVYGPGLNKSDPRIAARFPVAAAMGEDIRLLGTGNQVRSYCHISDAVTGIVAVLDEGEDGEVYTIADENSEVTILQFAELVAKAGNVNVTFQKPTHSEAEFFNPMRQAIFATEKLQRLGWKAATLLEEGIRDTVQYYRTML